MLQRASEGKRKVFFLGGSEAALAKIDPRLKREYPAIRACYYSPPYRNVFTREENRAMVEAVNRFRPDVLFVAMTAPKQEKWVEANKRYLDARVIMSIGAALDYYARTTIEPSRTLQRMGLQWLFRFIREPGRLWRRNLISMPRFIYTMLALMVRKLLGLTHSEASRT
jgi:N-acetylglucosaminyldiphosphoundecaprenol N-acetyl-beta-D-mannosaminyltransferase